MEDSKGVMMQVSSDTSIQPSVKRIGILLVGLQKTNLEALRYLVLQMNSLQSVFEYEFLPFEQDDEFVHALTVSPLDRETLRPKANSFLERQHKFLEKSNAEFNLKEPPPQDFILISLTRFSDNYYSLRQDKLALICLGNWKRVMAPPSILEFILTLILRQSVSSLIPSLRGSIHLGTKGCLCDFTASLEDVRYKVLTGFICAHCRKAMQTDGFPQLADELVHVLSHQWFGKPDEPNTPANITHKLGYDLFTTKGFESTLWERFMDGLREEGVKQIIQIVGAVIIAGLLIWLRLK